MDRVFIEKTPEKAGEKVRLQGWILGRRDHGKLIFVDLSDVTGMIQTVFLPGKNEGIKEASSLRQGDVVEITGTIQKRPEKMINPNLQTGTVELNGEELTILNKSETPPFELDSDGKEVSEENRLKYRYLDLRRARMLSNIKKRHKTIQFMRNYLSDNGFIEIETPILTKSTPEGARDYVVPSRLHQGKFYALPQSPQQYKQLLMVSGFEKYFQVARCFRDEDTRGDRQPEFTQLDIEMSFVFREDAMALNEALIIETIKKNFPEKKIKELPLPRIPYFEAMKNYGTDRPDLRSDKNDLNELALCWIIDFPFFEEDKKGGWTFTHNPFSAPMPEYMESLMQKKDIGKIITTQYDMVLNGFEIGGGSIRNHKPEALYKVFEILGLKEDTIKNNFGHMLQALSLGAPPHGGIAYGVDRIMAILLNEPNIREVMAFPKTGDGSDLMMNSPSAITKEQLRELNLKIKDEK